MKKIRPIALYTLVTAAMTVGAGSVLAQHSAGQDMDTDRTSTQRDQDAMHSSTMSTPSTKPMTDSSATSSTTPGSNATSSTSTSSGASDQPGAYSTPSDQSAQRAKDVVSQTPAADRANKPDHASMERMEHRGYVDTTPVNGVQASDLIGAEVKTIGGENVGPVDDLIIDENGQVVAILIGVGGFLNMGEKDVAIGWDDVTRTGDSDDQELTIDMTRDDLRPAPEYAKRD